MTYSLTQDAAQTLATLLKYGGEDTLLLKRPANELRASLALEPDATHIHAVLRCKSALHSIRLNRDDSANRQHLAEFVEQIANGVADTAEAAPVAGVFDRMLEQKRQAAADMVNHPPHYNGHPSGVECIEVTEHLSFNLGNAFKYVFRHRAKNGREDLEKARWYLARELQRCQPDSLPNYARNGVNDLAERIAAHEPYPVGAALVAIANGATELSVRWVDHLIATAETSHGERQETGA